MDQITSSLKPNILVAPLDWGLGHATRCIPVIHELIRQNTNVILAGEEKVKTLLQNEFPHLLFVDLKGYNISYSKNKWTLPFIIATQIPKILSIIKYENERLKEIVETHKIDGVIADNRYGLYHSHVPSVFICHQLLIKTNLGKAADEYLQKINYNHINKFSKCWIPDNENEPALAGELSHPEKKPSIPVRYVGTLSRFSPINRQDEKHILILLSGPEPQRTIFEDLLLEQLESFNGPVIFVRGLPGNTSQLKTSSNVTVYAHLPAKELNQKMSEASFIISRCGYSTVMDLAALKKKSILIPTPGQTEQEYLGKHLMGNNFALCIEQSKFKLKTALGLADNFPYQINGFKNESHLQSAVSSFLYQIESARFNR